MPETHSAWVVAAGAVMLSTGLLGHFLAMPEFVSMSVKESVGVKEGSETLKRFKKTPQPLHLHVYLFHVENPEEVSEQGARPVLVEKGPYVYDLFKERVELEFHNEDDSVSYYPKSTYHFNQKKSGCRQESDSVTVIHAPILGAALKLQQVSSMGLGIFNDAVPLLFSAKNIFLKTSVGELLFEGIFINCSYPPDSFPAGAVCEGMRTGAPPSYRRVESDFLFSMFGHLNGTSVERIRVSRGRNEPFSVGVIRAVGGNATLTKWRQDTPCNLINGTDGTIFAPFLRGTTVLPIYTSASCRSLYLFYQNDTSLDGLDAMRFVIDTNMLASGKDYPANRCFCVIPPHEQTEDDDEDPGVTAGPQPSIEQQELDACLPTGAMSLAPCSGSPIVLTFPHFYLGDKKFVEYPIGLNPNEEEHQTIVDIEPTTGIPVRAKKRVQLNMFLKKIEDFNYLTSVSEGLFPILWMEEGITLEGASYNKVVAALRTINVLFIIPWVFIVVGGMLLLFGLAYLSGLAPVISRMCFPKPPKVAAPTTLPDNDSFRMSMGHAPAPVYSDFDFDQKARLAGLTGSNKDFRGSRMFGESAVIPPYRAMYNVAGEYAEVPRQRPSKIGP